MTPRRRSARNPNPEHAVPRRPGLEAAAVSSRLTDIPSLQPGIDTRVIAMRVASPAALLIATAFKIGERHRDNPGRLLDKDAHDIYRLLRAVLARLAGDPAAVSDATWALVQDVLDSLPSE